MRRVATVLRHLAPACTAGLTAATASTALSANFTLFGTPPRKRVVENPFALPDKPAPSSLTFKDYTREELRRYTGANGLPILIAIRGDVFDCTTAREKYGPSAPYHMFGGATRSISNSPCAGREIARALALMSFAQAVVDREGDLSNLTPAEIESLESWEKFFRAKYSVVGKLK